MGYAIHLKVTDKVAKCGSRPYSWSAGLFLTDEESKVTCKRCLNTPKRQVHNEMIPEGMVGKIFRTSFGYDMTINRYVKVISQTEKSILVQELCINVEDDNGLGEGKSWPSDVFKGSKFPFRLILKRSDWGTYWVGDKTSWTEYTGGKDYYNTWD